MDVNTHRRALTLEEYVTGLLLLGPPAIDGEGGQARCLRGATTLTELRRRLVVAPAWDGEIVTHLVTGSVSADGTERGWLNIREIDLMKDGSPRVLPPSTFVVLRAGQNRMLSASVADR